LPDGTAIRFRGNRFKTAYGVTRRPDLIPIRRNPGEDRANG
jgi:hypothetical protein